MPGEVDRRRMAADGRRRWTRLDADTDNEAASRFCRRWRRLTQTQRHNGLTLILDTFAAQVSADSLDRSTFDQCRECYSPRLHLTDRKRRDFMKNEESMTPITNDQPKPQQPWQTYLVTPGRNRLGACRFVGGRGMGCMADLRSHGGADPGADDGHHGRCRGGGHRRGGSGGRAAAQWGAAGRAYRLRAADHDWGVAAPRAAGDQAVDRTSWHAGRGRPGPDNGTTTLVPADANAARQASQPQQEPRRSNQARPAWSPWLGSMGPPCGPRMDRRHSARCP